MKKKIILVMMLSFMTPPMLALSQDMVVYPAKGQSAA